MDQVQSGGVSKGAMWTGRVLSALVVLMMLFSASGKFLLPAGAVTVFEQLGWSKESALGLGILEVAVTVLYVIPRTRIVGAILLTAYLGGATATHVRINDQFIFPVIFGVLAWLGLWLRDVRLRPLMPLTKG
ncbi:MAG: DoxX family protein [Phycisphaerales bacterium]